MEYTELINKIYYILPIILLYTYEEFFNENME